MFLNERLQLPKRAIFPSLISGEGRFKFPIYFVQDAMNRSQCLKNLPARLDRPLIERLTGCEKVLEASFNNLKSLPGRLRVERK